ncbi:HD domain-containing protein [Desulforhabdus sp. TSK]|uniref:HD domain-containing protein n=1 Tax=Desulforhabdus sp. TSK TaxID=2925014 RepID=UPI001FC82E2C|nr:HD domain-containing protein [Desulforhabdus sp. TSK]
MTMERLEKQVQFVIEIDKLKQVVRQTLLTDASRLENSAEHSWHIAAMAILLHEYAAERDIDVFRVVKMLLIHDLVEIDAGDTYCYDIEGHADKAQREQAAADRIFNILPADQAVELRALWDEFERGQTPESRFAAALDRLQPLIHNYTTGGKMWQHHGVKKDLVVARNRHMELGAPTLWKYAAKLIDDAVAGNMLWE